MMGRGKPADRFLATVLFTDIVGSTDIAARLGDRQWRRVVAAHNAVIRRELKRFGGREVDTAGDGFFATFSQPAQAVRAADAMLSGVAPLGMTLRAGVHTGECEMIGHKVGGIAVHIGARVMASAAAGEVLVSSTVRDLVAGSGLSFEDRGDHELKGLSGTYGLFALVRQTTDTAAAESVAAQAAADEPTATGRRRVWLWALVGALVLGIIALGAVVFVLSTRPQTPAVVAGPDTLVTLDALSGAIVDVRRVPAGPAAVAFDGDGLWVASLDAGVVSELATGGGNDHTIGRVGRPTGLAVGGGMIWVADAFNQGVTLLDAASGEVLRTVEPLLARRITFGAGSGWAIDDVADQVLRLDRQSGEIAQTIALEAGAYPAGVAVGPSAVWVANAGTSTVVKLDPTSGDLTASGIALRTVPAEVAAGDRDVWISGPADDTLVRVDPLTNAVAATIPICDQPQAIVVDGESLWVGCAGAQEVWHLDREGKTLSKVSVGGVPTAIAIGDGRLYVAVSGP